MIVDRLRAPLPVPGGSPTASRPLVPPDSGLEMPVNARVVTVAPAAETRPHDHHDTEIWIVISGAGEVVEDVAVEPVAAGDAILLPPLGRHSLRNASPDEPLVFLTLWWEDMHAFDAALARRSDAPGDDRPVLLLPSFPTPNGDLHVGHLAGPYVAADVCKRALALEGRRALTLLGTVGHQSQVAVRAEQLGLSFYEAAEKYTDEIVATLAAADVTADVFVRPTSSGRYTAIARDVFARLHRDGVVTARRGVVNYCDACDRHLFEAFVVGTCPHCGSTDASGTECESCALHHDDSELQDPRCTTCGAPASRRELERFYMPLERLRARLESYLAGVPLSPRLAALAAAALAGPLPDVPVSYVADSGVELGVEGFERQRLYSSFELAARFLTALDQLSGDEGWERFARARKPRTVLFFGHDNAYLRAIIFPAVLASYTDAVPLPEALVMNEFYELSGSKFSTGRNHAIWGRDLVALSSSDAVRFHLAATRPEDERTNFTLDDFRARVERDLVGRLEVWLHELDERVRTLFDGAAPEAGEWNATAVRFYEQLRRACDELRRAYEPRTFSTRRAVETLRALVDDARRFGRNTHDLARVAAFASRTRTGVAVELMAARSVALFATPLVPSLAADALRGLGESAGPRLRWDAVPRWVRPGAAVDLRHVRVAPVRAGAAEARERDAADRRERAASGARPGGGDG